MHEIQKHILKKLALARRARYAALKPQGVEGNLFVYHLKALMREGYVLEEAGRYRLTPEGKRFIDRVSFETFRERIQPKIVTILAVQDGKGKYLLYRRRLAPFSGLIGFPYGKIHMEERLAEAARRELTEKTGLSADLRHRGEVYLTVHDDTELVAPMVCHVFSGKNPEGALRTDSMIGECFWEKLEDISPRELIPGVRQIARLLKKSRSHFFAEYFLGVNEEGQK